MDYVIDYEYVAKEDVPGISIAGTGSQGKPCTRDEMILIDLSTRENILY